MQSTGITYKINYTDSNKSKDNEYQYGVRYIGAFTSLFTTEYVGKYTGKIAEADEDPYIRSGKWYTFKEAFGIFNTWHRDALLQYIKLNLPTEEYTTEGYFLNRVKNSVLLKSKNIQEIDINASNYMVSQIVMKYNKLRFTSGNKKVTVGFYKVPLKSGGSFEVGIVIDFGGDKVGNPAYAYKTVGGDDAITFNPAFFKASKDDQLFTLLHELGHIRLKHTDPNNYKRAFGRRYDPYVTRGNDIKRGGVSYVELNADTYSVLNGGKAYTLLNPDHGDDEDSKLNNLELARRFDIATRRKDAFERRYGTIESAEDELTTESYFTNWFANEFKLWSKEIRTDTPQECLEHTLMLLDKAYLKHKNDKKYQNNKIYSFATTTGPNFKKDGKYTTELISYCINFTDKNNGPAYAMVSDNGENLVVVTPEYFTMSKETKKYVLLHEIGHIRLDHLNPKNIPVDLFGNPMFDKIRSENILSGKTMYTELNADLYAILNGAKLYTILDVAHKQDFDSEKNPFIYSNYEIADRFKKATERALRRDLFKGLPNIG